MKEEVRQDESEGVGSYLDGLKGTTGYWKLEEETLDLTVWRTGLVRGYRTVVKQVRE